MRRSTLTKSSMPISGARASPPGTGAAGAGGAARTARRASSGRRAASGAGRSPMVCAPIARPASATSAARCFRKASTCAASAGSTGLRYSVSRRKASMQTVHTSCSAASWPACLAISQGLCWSTYSLTLSASSITSRSALPNSRSSYSVAMAPAVRAQAVQQHAALDTDVGTQPAAEALAQEAGGAAGDVDVLAHQVGVDPGDEVVGVEVEVLDAGVELGGDVVAQPLGVHAELQVAQRADAGAAALAHLLAADGEVAVHVDAVRHLAAAEVQHRRPEQRVEGDDVLADEVDLLHLGLGQVGLEVDAQLAEPVSSGWPGSRSARRARRRSTCPARRGSRCRSTARRG
jgi:hypothetical protein